MTGINGVHEATRKVYQYKYQPQPDITVYELALIQPLFTLSLVGGNVVEFINSLPDEAKRHFEEVVG